MSFGLIIICFTRFFFKIATIYSFFQNESINFSRTKTMGKIMKPGRVAIVLGGRYAGRKAIVIKSYDEGTAERRYGHALIAGIDKYPLKVVKRMSKKKVEKRIRIKPFIKVTSLQHLLPTRCVVDADFDKAQLNKECLKEPKKKKMAMQNVKKELENHYKAGKSKWLFTKLRF